VSIWANIIKRFKAPALPVASRTYDPQYFDKLLSVLRLYFNQLDNLLEQIVSASPVAVNFYGSALDAFGRARFSQPYTLFDSQNRYAKNDLFSESTATGGAVTYIANESTVNMTTTTSSGSEVVRQTLRSFSYQPGKGLLVMNTFVVGVAQANQRVRVGYFNTDNGVFFELDGTTLYMVRRTYVTGTPVDNRVAQADWNGDKLNGTGDSGFTIDITKAQIFWQDFEWLGVGSVRCGFVIDGQTIVCHTFKNANNLDRVYMTTAILPVRYEIRNTGTTGVAGSLRQICSTVISEGGYEKKVATDVVRMTTANTSIGVNFVPLASIRLASGRTGAVIIPDGYSVLPTAASSVTFEVALIKNATLTGASWVASSSANVEQDLSATALTGGTIIFSSYVVASTQSSAPIANGADYNWDLQLGATLAGVSDTYTIAVRALSGTHTAIGTMAFWDLT
jgi:hypothetical protein